MNILRNHIEKIITLTDEEFELIDSFFHSKKYKKKDFVIKENASVDHVYFIVSGLMKLYVTDRDAKEHIISFSMEDWWETDYMAFYTQTKATQFLQCLEDTEVLCLSFSDYQKLNNRIPKLEHFFLQKAIGGHIANQKRILSLLTLTVQEKYEQLLNSYPTLLQRIPKTVLANYLGVSRETLSRFFVASKKM
ncbi:MAG: Crp/Fnr family transcriptional regulator [Chryseobacterium sp.]|nr:Crp/Fnr family transcriptional regulator [Chryseobacterium sp.]